MTTQNSISTSSSSIVHPCNLCSEQFDGADKLARHKWRKHVNAVQVIHEGISKFLFISLASANASL